MTEQTQRTERKRRRGRTEKSEDDSRSGYAKSIQRAKQEDSAIADTDWSQSGVWQPSGTTDDAAYEMADHHIQRALKGTGTSQNEVPDQVLDVVGSGGQSLDYDLQQDLERRMGADFSDVRIHTGGKAAEAADAIDARAFTCGNDIVFNSGEYNPDSPEGQFLLAHELAHVKQQNGGAPLSMMPKPDADLEIDPDPQLERQADEAAKDALTGEAGPATVSRMGTDVQIQRVEDNDYYEHVIAAIREQSDLDQEDIDRIKEEAKQDISGTDYDKAKGHDELNLKIVQEAEELVQEKVNSLKQKEKLDESTDVLEEIQQAADIDRKTGQAENGEITDSTDGYMDANEVEDLDLGEKEEELNEKMGELSEEVTELDAELRELFSSENFRLTEAQIEAIEGMEDKIAQKFDGPAGDFIAAWLTNTVTVGAAGMSLAGLVAKLAGTGTVTSEVAATGVLLIVANALSMVASSLASSYDSSSDYGEEAPEVPDPLED